MKNPGYKARPKGARHRAGKAKMAWAGKLILLTYGVRMYTDAKRWDVVPDLGLSEPFSESGEFKVGRAYATSETRPFGIIIGDRKVVVQLLDRQSKPIFATYVRENDLASVQVPRGTWMIRLIEGHACNHQDQARDGALP